jgi:hypothetical protein
MPLELRRRLDLVGLRVSLAAWQAMALVTRAALRAHPIDDTAARAAFAARARAACAAVDSQPREVPAGIAWETPEAFAAVRERAGASGAPLDVVTWAGLHDAHRFALHHLAAPSRDAERFRAVLRASGAAPW